ncbi:hypothetical protein [Dickeya fangzhongdai]|uniref:Uncharacterized protein n=1 Tax=Dickeya fangzhongdai TaxID=1778540 RepID=A0A2K8QHU5_9GAMM|nr:hypothetical protein [Dickeya fangzhongdai]ATZ93044.1 hypothetical protein CVE23_03070 [Dickeya fangzhongdai]QOH46475.1 hypothetical protein DYD82_03105 [Dickeya fangzhongdai]QOH50781.1 hypothetical protein DYD83_03105 [Dickeya fangzhongdai]GGB97765.1 hypothetical protein GCM10007171_13570 [Dickeya fangzhongdai]
MDIKHTDIPPLQRVLGQMRRGVRRTLLILAVITGTMLIALLIARLGMSHPDEFLALRQWMQHTRMVWLVWRLALYSALGWGLWKVWRASGCKPEYRKSLIRIAIVGAVFLLICEYAIFSAPGEAS